MSLSSGLAVVPCIARATTVATGFTLRPTRRLNPPAVMATGPR
jgi:hypothetical protein